MTRRVYHELPVAALTPLQEPTQAYMDALQKFRNQNPLDLNFIVELGKIGKCVGGNGFGTATCRSDQTRNSAVADDICLQVWKTIAGPWVSPSHRSYH